jgi:uncharacterized coiled-coil protein SlyX
MDEELKAYLVAMEERLLEQINTNVAMEQRLLEPINTKLDDILDKLARQQEDLHAIRGHMLYGLEDGLTMSKRITKLEEEIRQRREGK